jgi:hypothetical protein
MSTYTTTTGATGMDDIDRTLQINTLAYGGQVTTTVTTTYTRADLGIDTAVISQDRPGGPWAARLYDGPEEHTSETVALESTAEKLATEHSLSF